MLYFGFRCHIVHVKLTGVGGNAAVGQGHAVCGCHNGCMCLVWVWGEGVYNPLYGGCWSERCREWVQVLMEKRWYLPRCCGCGPKEPVCSLVHCV